MLSRLRLVLNIILQTGYNCTGITELFPANHLRESCTASAAYGISQATRVCFYATVTTSRTAGQCSYYRVGCAYITLRVAPIRYSNPSGGLSISNHWSDVPPKTQIGHEIHNSTFTISLPQGELETNRLHIQDKKPNCATLQHYTPCDICRIVKCHICMNPISTITYLSPTWCWY